MYVASSRHGRPFDRTVIRLSAMGAIVIGTLGMSAPTPRLEALYTGTAVTPALSGLQVTLLDEGERINRALGFAAERNNALTPLSPAHKVRVASISKLVVAIGVMQLVEQGRVDLDGDISSYVGFRLRNPRFPDTPITPRQLLSHTSSIRDGEQYFIAAGNGALSDFFAPGSSLWDGGHHFASDDNKAPGQFFRYSNLNFGVLGTLIEHVSGQRFDRYISDHIMTPLGLTASFNVCDVPEALRATTFRKRNAKGEWNSAGPWNPQVDYGNTPCFYGMAGVKNPESFLSHYLPGRNATLFSPQGGLRASADDLLTLLRVLINHGTVDGVTLLTPKSVETMLAPTWSLANDNSNGHSAGEATGGGPDDGLMTRYGLSVHLIDMREWGFSCGPRHLAGHLGNAYGVLSMALWDLDSGNGIATIITGTADDPALSPRGHSPLYRVEEELLRWWLAKSFDCDGTVQPRPTAADNA